MKRLVLMVLAGLALLATPAHADALPKAFLGTWCVDGQGEGAYGAKDPDSLKTCPGYYMIIGPKGYELDAGDFNCKYVSIKHVGKSLARTEVYTTGNNDTEESLPVLSIVGRCKSIDEGERFTDRRTLACVKDGLIVSVKKRP